MWHALWRFLRRAALPGGWIVNALGFVGGVTATTIVGFVFHDAVAAIAVGALLAVILMAVAGTKLQAEADRRESSDFACVGVAERVPWEVEVNGWRYSHSFVCWVNVTNHGPTSTFAAKIVDIDGVPAEWGANYEVVQPPWERAPDPDEQIARGGTRRIKLAGVLHDPPAFWFYTAQTGQELPGNQMRLDGPAEITFRLQVVNTGDRDQTVNSIGRISIPHANDATFSLQPQ